MFESKTVFYTVVFVVVVLLIFVIFMKGHWFISFYCHVPLSKNKVVTCLLNFILHTYFNHLLFCCVV